MTAAVRLWIFSLNYAPEPTGFAPHATALAEYMAGKGHAVTVVTGFPFAPRWRRWPEYQGVFSSQTVHNGVTLRRVSHFIPRRPGSIWQRVAMEASFCVAAAAVLAPRLMNRREKPDVVLYIGAQPALAMLARVIARVCGVPYLVNINDLAAESAYGVGIVRTNWMQRALEWLEFVAYLPSAGASVLCRSFAEALIAHGYPKDRIRLIRSPTDVERIRPLPSDPECRDALGVPRDAFVVLFAGSMGLKQGLANVIEAARQLNHRTPVLPTVAWVLVGDGETRNDIETLIDQYDLRTAVRLVPFQPEDRVASMLAAADVLLLNQLSSVKDSVIPSKLLTYMAAGRPVLAAVNGASQGAEILRETMGGVLAAPEDPLALIRGVEALAQAGPDARARMGERNRAYAAQHFDQRKILAEHEAFILDRTDSRR